MRILICISEAPLPPLNTGMRRQLTGLLPELSKRNEVRFVGYRWPGQVASANPADGIRLVPYVRPGPFENAKDLALAMVLQRPLRAERLVRGLSPAFQEELERFKPDVVMVGTGKLAGLLNDLKGQPNVFWAMETWHLNVEARALAAHGLRRWLLYADAKRMQRYEAGQYRGWDRVVASNKDDRDTMLVLDPTLPMTIIPIGFDASAYKPDPTAVRDRRRIIFHGAMNYAPNVTCAEFLAKRILPRVRAVRPDAHLAIVGRDPTPGVLALGELNGVQVVGGVDDMQSWLTGSRVWAGPFQSGTGIKTKVLEAMATNLPCVVTPLGARGLDWSSGTFLVGSTEEELAMHLNDVLNDDEMARRLGTAGGDYVRATYDWPVVGRAFESLFEEVIAAKNSASRPRR